MTNSYIAVDLETTGLNPKTEKIIEIGAIKVIDGVICGEYHTLVQPHRELTEWVRELTGITDAMLESTPGIEDCIDIFLKFCEDLPLLGHHVIFDYSFLKRAAVNHKQEFERKGIDTLPLCRRFMPAENKKTLVAACEYYGIIRQQAHRALDDAKAAHQLYQLLLDTYGMENSGDFALKPLIYKIKREQPASKKQKEDLRYLLKYHKIEIPVQIDYLSRNEISRITDKIISQYGRIN